MQVRSKQKGTFLWLQRVRSVVVSSLCRLAIVIDQDCATRDILVRSRQEKLMEGSKSSAIEVIEGLLPSGTRRFLTAM